MRLVLVALLLSACGGGGRCENPPCRTPIPTCDSDEDCFASELCDFENNSCGASFHDLGHCTRRPTGCTGQVDFICGCDGLTYANDCAAAAAGFDVDSAGGCPPPPNAFPCGGRFCDRDEQVCVETKFGPEASDFRCTAIPAQCRANRTCACIDPMRQLDCRETNGGITVTQEVVPDPAATASAAAPPASTAAWR